MVCVTWSLCDVNSVGNIPDDILLSRSVNFFSWSPYCLCCRITGRRWTNSIVNLDGVWVSVFSLEWVSVSSSSLEWVSANVYLPCYCIVIRYWIIIFFRMSLCECIFGRLSLCEFIGKCVSTLLLDNCADNLLTTFQFFSFVCRRSEKVQMCICVVFRPPSSTF